MGKIDTREDTIAAIATSFGEGAVGIVRVSGPDAVSIVDKVFRSKNKKPLSTQKSFSLRYGWIKDAAGETVDEVIVSLMRAPRSYTREDVVEINAHGGPRALSGILDLVLGSGARAAQPGEFTKRAFLNGRLDLVQAEAVLDVIEAKSALSLKNGLHQLSGAVSRRIVEIRTALLVVLAEMEARLDFSEEEGVSDGDGFLKSLQAQALSVQELLEHSFEGRIIREGLRVAICGRPNVGKSSLLNALLRQERAIVTPIAGTTRDTIEEFIGIKGLAVRLIDTAGILEHRDEIEREALNRTKQALDSCDLALFVLDASSELTPEDERLSTQIKDKKRLIAVNKSDLPLRLDLADVRRRFGAEPVLVSASKGTNILALEEAVRSSVLDKPGCARDAAEGALISNVRHIELLKQCCGALSDAGRTLAQGLSLEFAAIDVRRAADNLGLITGEVASDELLDMIFSKFCIGK